MFNHNHFSIIGRLTRDPEFSYTQNNKPLAKFSIACNAGKAQDGQGEQADFFDCLAWEKTAELVQNYLHKGSKCFFEGRLKQNKWTDRESGKMRSRVELVIRNIEFLDTRQAEGAAAAGGEWAPGGLQEAPRSAPTGQGMPGGYTRPPAQGAPISRATARPGQAPGQAPRNQEIQHPAARPQSSQEAADAAFEKEFEDNPPDKDPFDPTDPEEVF